MSFYVFSQNNSGGVFTGPAEYVIIEAKTVTEANNTAIGVGLYFDGAGDCECCGKRWRAQWDGAEGTETPEVYDKKIEDIRADAETKRRNFHDKECEGVLVVWADGKRETFDYDYNKLHY